MGQVTWAPAAVVDVEAVRRLAEELGVAFHVRAYNAVD